MTIMVMWDKVSVISDLLHLFFHTTDEDDLDGIPLVYDDYKRKKRDSSEEDSQSQDNGSEYSEDSRGFDRLQG